MSALDLLSSAALLQSISSNLEVSTETEIQVELHQEGVEPSLDKREEGGDFVEPETRGEPASLPGRGENVGVPIPEELIPEDGDQTDDEENLPAAGPTNFNLKRQRSLSDNGTREVPPHAVPFLSISSLPSLPPLPALPSLLPAFFPTGPTSAPLLSFSLQTLPPLPPTSILPLQIPSLPPPLIRPPIPDLVPEDSGIIRCVCSFTSDDGFTIQCDSCNVWQHGNCVGILPEAVPDEYMCELCDPKSAIGRGVDGRKAEESQRRRLEAERLGYDRSGVDALRRGPGNTGFGGARPRRSLGEDVAGTSAVASPTNGPLSPADSLVTSTPTVPRDALGRRRRSGKQPGTGTRGRGAAGNSTPSTATPGGPNESPAPEPPSHPRLASFGVLRNTNNFNNTNSGPPSDDEDGLGDDKYEAWQYEFTPVERDLYPEPRLVERLTQALHSLEFEDEIPLVVGGLKELWEKQSTLRPRTQKDPLLPLLYDAAPIVLESIPSPSPTQVQPLPSTAFQLVPPVSSTFIPPVNQNNPCPYPRPTTYALFSVNSISSGAFISTVRGKVVSLQQYRSDPVNQYSLLGVPKQGVNCLPQPWSVAIDQRLFGNEVRFARSGCHPNAVLRVIKLKKGGSSAVAEEGGVTTNLNPTSGEGSGTRGSTPWTEQARSGELGFELVFAIFATVDIGRREEIVLPWDWDDNHLIHSLPSLIAAPPLPEFLSEQSLEPLSRKMGIVTNAILSITHCACDKKRDCALYWLCKGSVIHLPISRAAAAKREPFSTIFLNAIGAMGKDEMGKSRGRKSKKPDLGPLVALERGWIAYEEPVVASPVSIKLDLEVEMDLDEDLPSGKENVATQPMDLDDVQSTASTSRLPPPPKLAEEADSDASDLTDALSHLTSSDEEGAKPAPRNKARRSDDDEEDEQVVRPPPRRRLVSGAKRNSKLTHAKDVGPSKKKAREREREREREAEKEKEKSGKRKHLVKFSEKGGKEEEEDGERKKTKKKEIESSREEEAKKLGSSTSKKLKPRPSLEGNQPSTSTHDVAETKVPQLDPSSRPLLPEDTNSLAAPVRDVTPLLVVPVEPAVIEPVVVKEPTPPPPPPPVPRARLSLAEYRQRQAQKATDPLPTPPLPVPTVEPPVPVPTVEDPPPARSDTPPLPTPLILPAPYLSPPSRRLPPLLIEPVDQEPPIVLSPGSQYRALNTTEDVLKSIGDYFSKPPTSGPLAFVRPIPTSVHLSPLPRTSSLPSPSFQAPFEDYPSRPEFSSRQSSTSLSTGLGLDSGPPARREYGRPHAVYTGSSYSSTKYEQPPSPNLSARSGSGASPSFSTRPLPPASPAPASPHLYHRPPPQPSPTSIRGSGMHDTSLGSDVPTAPRGMSRSPNLSVRPLGAAPPSFPNQSLQYGANSTPAEFAPGTGTNAPPPASFRFGGPRGGAGANGPFRGGHQQGRFENNAGATLHQGGAGRGRYDGIPRGPSSSLQQPMMRGRGRGWGARGRGRG